MIEMAAIVSGFTIETIRGPQTGESLMRSLSTGDLAMPVEGLTDSYSIFSYLAAAHLKLPAEKSTYYHLAFLREKLVNGFISTYNWIDTRDMVADGLTKGLSDRSLLSALMDGSYTLAHPVHEYREPSSSATSSTLASSSTSLLGVHGHYTHAPTAQDVSRGCSAASATFIGNRACANGNNATEDMVFIESVVDRLT